MLLGHVGKPKVRPITLQIPNSSCSPSLGQSQSQQQRKAANRCESSAAVVARLFLTRPGPECRLRYVLGESVLAQSGASALSYYMPAPVRHGWRTSVVPTLLSRSSRSPPRLKTPGKLSYNLQIPTLVNCPTCLHATSRIQGQRGALFTYQVESHLASHSS